jgi:acyl-CoA reductase-like NAD-dependent aldehyde dehydrogenase
LDGASFDNNVLCIAEKEVFVVDAVADRLMAAMDASAPGASRAGTSTKCFR